MMRSRSVMMTVLALGLLQVAAGPASALSPGREAPELVVERWHQIEEDPSLADLRGQVVLLDFWGLWCSPCVKALPALNGLARTYGDRGLTVIGIHTPAKADQLEAFLQEREVAFPVAEDTGKTAQRYQLRNYPTYVLIDRQGRVHSTGIEVPDAETIDKLLLAGP